jgi:O-acetyl-ADP-ribose deacetylase (regulator of RNase III)
MRATARKMLIYHRTSIFDSQAQTVVNTVNCVGVMGKGIAARFKRDYPDMFQSYKDICDRKLLEPGKLWLWKTSDRWILNFPTKRHWRYPSKLEWIDAGLVKFVAEYEKRGITEISFPRLGCGNGGLDWDDVRPLMEKHLSPLRITIYVHDYEVSVGLPEHMEPLEGRSASGIRIDRSFEDFIGAIQDVVDEQACRFTTLLSGRPFEVQFVPGHQIEIGSGDQRTMVDLDDLRSIWVKLLHGLVTQEAVEWGPHVDGEFMLSLLSMLPQIRPVQIQRRNAAEPEIAVELRHRRGATVPDTFGVNQPEHAWG